MLVIPQVPYCSVPSVMKLSQVAQSYLILLILLLSIRTSQSVDRNIGIDFTIVPESRVAPPKDTVYFRCKTNLGPGKGFYHIDISQVKTYFYQF